MLHLQHGKFSLQACKAMSLGSLLQRLDCLSPLHLNTVALET